MDYLRRFFQWFVSGLGFAIALALVLWAFNALTKQVPMRTVTVQEPSDRQQVVELAQITFAKHLVVSGTLVNDFMEKPRLSLALELYRGGKRFYRCRKTEEVSPLPQKRLPVQLECPELETASLPSDITFQVQVFKIHEEQVPVASSKTAP